MGSSFTWYSFAIFLFLAGPSFGLYRDGRNSAFQQSDQARFDLYRSFYPAPARTTGIQNTLKQKMLDAFIANFLQRKTSVDDPSVVLEDELVEDEAADRLTAITRYVGIGYNLLKGSPDGDFSHGGVDPGILATRAIFDFTYKGGTEAYYMDTTVQVPDQVTFQPLESCSAKNRASVYSGAKSYQNSLNFGINPKGIL